MATFSLKRILFPTDFSDTAACSLDYASGLASRFGARLHVLHVVPDPMSQDWAGEAGGISFPDLRETWIAEAERRLGELSLSGVETQRATRVGHAFVEIVRYARENDIDLIVMGTHGRGAVSHMLLGSVAEKVVRKAPCPVLTVRKPGHTFVMPTMPVM